MAESENGDRRFLNLGCATTLAVCTISHTLWRDDDGHWVRLG